MVLGKLPVPGRPTIWIIVGQGPTAPAVGAGGGCLDIFTLIYPFFPLSPSLWETARYRLKHCLKGPFNPKPTNLFCRKRTKPSHLFVLCDNQPINEVRADKYLCIILSNDVHVLSIWNILKAPLCRPNEVSG